MSAIQPVAVYAVQVPPGVLVPAVPKASAMFRVSMAAIDPEAMPEYEESANGSKPPRSTLKIVRPPPGLDFDDDSEDDDDYDDDDDDDDDSEDEEDDESDEDEENGGPSDPAKVKQARKAAAMKDMENALDEDDSEEDDEEDLKAAISKLIKGKGKATDDESESLDGLELEETVVCTLDPEKNCQQPLDFVVAENERIFFKVNGTHTVYLTGNYVIPVNEQGLDDDSDEEDDEYDLSPDEAELELLEEDDESDALDGLDNPRIVEMESDEEAPKITKPTSKGKNKRPAEDSEDEEKNLDDIIAKSLKPATEPTTNGEAKLSKKQLKKLKKNNGKALEVTPKSTENAKEKPTATKTDKKVQFAKNLEQGPTPSPPKKESDKPTLGVKEVQGVTIDDRKLGTGRTAKNGDRVSMRYIGRLEDGKVFDANKKGTPFSFKLGGGEVIKGWDIGIVGMAVGGERKVIIPSHLAYAKKAQPGIPANSKLYFDVKLLEIK